jgi:transcriptional regulator with XRE-family HTH domain
MVARKIREQKRLSQEEVALRMGKMQSRVSRIEDQDTDGFVQIRTLVAMAKALGVEMTITFATHTIWHVEP